MASGIEGTVDDGENDDNNHNGSDFESWLKGKDVQDGLVKKLLKNNINSMEMLKEIQDEPLTDLKKEFGLSISQKARLKILFTQIPYDDKQVTTDKAERDAIAKMNNKLKLIQKSLENIENTKQNINKEVIKCKANINQKIDLAIAELNKRRKTVLTELNKVAQEKNNKLNSKYKELNTHLNNTKKVIHKCNCMIKKPINLNDVDNRKEIILKMAENIYKTQTINNSHSMISNYKINTLFNTTMMIKGISNYGAISSIPLPILISVTDNTNNSMNIEWKLETQFINVNNFDKKVKIEWKEISNDDDNKSNNDNQVEWINNKEITVQNLNDNSKINIKVQKSGSYLVRMTYFDGVSWSCESNHKSVNVTNDVKSVNLSMYQDLHCYKCGQSGVKMTVRPYNNPDRKDKHCRDNYYAVCPKTNCQQYKAC